MEIYLRRESSNGSDDGVLTIWLDGVQLGTRSDVDNYATFAIMDLVRIGAVGGIDAGTSGTLYLDEFVMRDDNTEIGPVA